MQVSQQVIQYIRNDNVEEFSKLKIKDTLVHDANSYLKICAYHNRPRIAKLICEMKNRNSLIDYSYLMTMSAASGHVEMVKFFLDRSADANYLGGIAVKIAALIGNLEIIKELVPKIKDKAIFGMALVYAACNGHIDVARYMVGKGADVQFNNNSAIYLANANGHQQMVEYLLDLFPKNAPSKIILPENPEKYVISIDVNENGYEMKPPRTK